MELPVAANAWPVEARSVVADLAEGICGALGSGMLGLYVYGSLVTGDFDTTVSDVDLLTVLDRDLSPDAFQRLDRVHKHIASRHPRWKDRIEVIYLSQDALRTFRESRSPIAVISPGEPFHFGDDDAGEEWMTNWFVVHEQGVALAGPAPSTFIARIGVEDVVDQLRAEAPSWPGKVAPGSHPGRQAYVILTACRTLYLAAHGQMTSKIKAASWAQVELAEWADLIDRAVQMRALGGWTGEMDRERTLAFLRAAAELADRELANPSAQN